MLQRLGYTTPCLVYCGCLRLGNCHVLLQDSQKQFALKGGRRTSFTSTTHTTNSLKLRIPFFPLLSFPWQSHAHMTIGQSPIHSQHQELLQGRPKPSPLYHAWGHLFLWGLGGPYSPYAHQRSFLEHAENLTQFEIRCIHHCHS